MFIHAWRYKAPYLIQQVGYDQKYRRNQCELEGCKKGRGNLGCNHGRPLGQDGAQRLRDEGINLVGKGEQADEHD